MANRNENKSRGESRDSVICIRSYANFRPTRKEACRVLMEETLDLK